VTTYSQWLDDQAEQRNDDVGEVARVWAASKGERPRASAVATISQWLGEHAIRADIDAGRFHAAVREATAEYRHSRHADPQQAADQGEQQPDQPGDQQPGLPADGPPMVQLTSYDQPSPAIMAALGRIERVLAELATGQLAMAAQLRPLMEVLAEIPPEAADAYDAATEAQDGPPDGHGQPAGGLWRAIMVPEPDWAALDAAADPAALEGDG
jgi:hypothetical protein